jgi:uncharacterized protein YrzB (UPF0473 family)
MYPTLNNKKELLELPDKNGNSTGYHILGIAKTEYDVYVCFANLLTKEVWIEKTHKLLLTNHVNMNILNKIDNDNEFAMAYKFFLDKGLLK